jgi:FKBP-type peptidyl-prolyl cis-trans isomerase
LAAALGLAGCAKQSAPPPAAKANPGELTMTASGLKYQDLKVGSGRAVAKGDVIAVEYTGTLADGTVFDTSKNAGKPFEFTVGNGAVIKGWDEGVENMKVGGVRKLVIPAVLGYGDKGSPPKIPPGATLYFEIELKEIK